MPEITFGSRIRKSPYFDATIAAGASAFTIYNKMYMPTAYGDPAAEYARLTQTVAIWDVAAERQVEIVGPDAAALTQYLSARDLTTLKVGRARYAPICDHHGRLINDPVVLRVDDHRFWLSIADSDLLLWARAVAGERGFDAIVDEPDVSPLAIQGPRADDLASDLFGAALVSSLGFFHHVPVTLDGIAIVLCRSGWSKQGGFELFLTDSTRGQDLWHAVVAAGERYGIGPGSPNHTERIESGLLSFGSDHDRSTDPFEAGLGQYVSLDVSHDFIGKQALLACDPSRRRPIVNVRLSSDPLYQGHPQPAIVDGSVVGQVQTCTWSPRLDAWIGLAQLSAPHCVPGSTIDVQTQAGWVTATVQPDPFGAIQQ